MNSTAERLFDAPASDKRKHVLERLKAIVDASSGRVEMAEKRLQAAQDELDRAQATLQDYVDLIHVNDDPSSSATPVSEEVPEDEAHDVVADDDGEDQVDAPNEEPRPFGVMWATEVSVFANKLKNVGHAEHADHIRTWSGDERATLYEAQIAEDGKLRIIAEHVSEESACADAAAIADHMQMDLEPAHMTMPGGEMVFLAVPR